MNKATNICIINFTLALILLANTYQIENDDISFEHGADKFQCK